MIMVVNNSCIPGNDTSTCPDPSSSPTGLAVGLTFFFLLLLIAAGVTVYKCHGKMRSMLRFGNKRSSHKKQDDAETPPQDSHHYITMIREQSTGPNPIYENLTTRTTRPAVKKLPSETEEDVYLQCDSPDDAIYSNDPECNLSILSHYQEEDVYIVPDS